MPTVPAPVAGSLRFTQSPPVRRTRCALSTDHLVYCWGSNGNGQLGTGAHKRGFEPAKLMFAARVIISRLLRRERDVEFLDRLQGSFDQLALYIPALLGALVILFAGYLLAKLLERAIDRGLNRLGLNRWLERGGVLNAVERTGWRRTPSRLVGNIAFWFVMFAVILVAAHALGLVVAHERVLGAGELHPERDRGDRDHPRRHRARRVRRTGCSMASAGGMPGGPTLARVGRGGVIMLAIFMALQELGIATEIVTTAFAIMFGALALAFALSFGLGNRELAGEITREWYERLRAERETIAWENREARRARIAGARGDRGAPGREPRRSSIEGSKLLRRK